MYGRSVCYQIAQRSLWRSDKLRKILDKPSRYSICSSLRAEVRHFFAACTVAQCNTTDLIDGIYGISVLTRSAANSVRSAANGVRNDVDRHFYHHLVIAVFNGTGRDCT